MQENKDEFQGYEDIDLIGLIKIVWSGKIKILTITCLAALFSVMYSLSLPNIFKSEILLAPADSSLQGTGGLGSYGGLASLAGVSLGPQGASDVTIGLATLKSRAFITDFIERRDILAPLMALESWTEEKVEINADVYDLEKKTWIDEKPSLQSAYGTFQSILSFYKEDTGLVKISISNQSPVLAQQWVSWLVEDLNNSIRDGEIKEAKRSIAFLEKQMQSTTLVDMRSVLFSLIEQQTEIIMLASVRSDYLFKVLDPAIVNEDKSSPNRFLICILGTLFGGFLSVLFVFLMHFLQSKKTLID
jgi:LPS O-antigen subunit length determinant protein (WzzB/FepE family)